MFHLGPEKGVRVPRRSPCLTFSLETSPRVLWHLAIDSSRALPNARNPHPLPTPQCHQPGLHGQALPRAQHLRVAAELQAVLRQFLDAEGPGMLEVQEAEA